MKLKKPIAKLRPDEKILGKTKAESKKRKPKSKTKKTKK